MIQGVTPEFTFSAGRLASTPGGLVEVKLATSTLCATSSAPANADVEPLIAPRALDSTAENWVTSDTARAEVEVKVESEITPDGPRVPLRELAVIP